MAQAKLVAAIIFVVLAVVLIVIATVIIGLVARKYPSGDTKNRLLGATGLSGLTILISAVASILGIFYGRARQSGSSRMKGLGIAFIIFAVLAVLMYVIVIILTMSVRSRIEINASDKTSLIAAVVLIGLGFVSMVIGSILVFSLSKGQSTKQILSRVKK